MSRKRVATGEALFKVIMVGDSATGKSCLLSRYVKDHFSPEYHVTLGTPSLSQVPPLPRRR
jgi:GTPase SAR1 family protein